MIVVAIADGLILTTLFLHGHCILIVQPYAGEYHFVNGLLHLNKTSRIFSRTVYASDCPLVTKRKTTFRGAKSNGSIAIEDGLKQLSVKSHVDSGAPVGYSPLDPKRIFTVVSTKYLISGKVKSGLRW